MFRTPNVRANWVFQVVGVEAGRPCFPPVTVGSARQRSQSAASCKLALKLGHKDRRLATEQRRELGVPIRHYGIRRVDGGAQPVKNATADHPVQLERCASRSKLIPSPFKRCSTAIRCRMAVQSAGQACRTRAKRRRIRSCVTAVGAQMAQPNLSTSSAKSVKAD